MSHYADDFVRYALDRNDAELLVRQLENELPSEVVWAISRSIQQHGNDTGDLLRHVYLTTPMLNAKPNESLDFRVAFRMREERSQAAPLEPEKLSVKAKKRRAQLIEQARVEIQRRLTAASTRRLTPSPAPRYDEVFREGTARLDQIAGEPVHASQGEIEFDDSVWQSSQRRDPDFS